MSDVSFQEAIALARPRIQAEYRQRKHDLRVTHAPQIWAWCAEVEAMDALAPESLSDEDRAQYRFWRTFLAWLEG